STETYGMNGNFTGLVPDTTYYAQVKAVNHYGVHTNYLNLGSTMTLLQLAPINLQFTNANTGYLTATWDEPDVPGDTYDLELSTANDFTGTIFSSNTVLLNATRNGLAVNTTYYGRVRSNVTGVPSDWSTPAPSTATLADIPDHAATTWTAVNVTSLTVAWSEGTNPPSVTWYVIEISTADNFTGGDDKSTETYGMNGVFSNLVPDTTYYAQVKAVNHSGIDTNYLNLGSTETLAADLPKNLTFTAASTNTLTATWGAPDSGADSYELEISTHSNFSSANISSSTVLNTATIGNLLVNTTYYGHVRSFLSGSTTPWTTYETTSTLAEVPAYAVSTWTVVNVTSLTVTWAEGTNPLSVTRYVVEVSTANDFTGGDDTSTVTYGLNGVFTGLMPDTTYYAQVMAVNHSGIDTNYLNLGSTETLPATEPGSFQFVASSSYSLTADWTASDPAGDTYTLQLSTANDFTGTIHSSQTAALSAERDGLAVNTTYYGRVRADINSGVSPWSNPIVTTATLADIPDHAATTWTAVNVTSLTVTWTEGTNPPSVTWYVIEISTANNFTGGDDKSTETYGLNGQFTGLMPETTYYAQVKAVNHYGVHTNYLNLGSTETLPATEPGSFQYIASSSYSLTGDWTASDPAGDTYTMQLSTANDFTGTIHSSQTAALSAERDGLAVNTTYYGRVRADINSGVSPWSNPVVTTATLADIPDHAATTWTAVNVTSLTVTWTEGTNPPSVTWYVIEISTANNFTGGDDKSTETYGMNGNFTGLVPDTTYYAQVKAVNHYGVHTNYLNLGST
ncbi:hypothetical protein BVX98_00455, partial [bacterium F11]